jgi:hypothetical protein
MGLDETTMKVQNTSARWIALAVAVPLWLAVAARPAAGQPPAGSLRVTLPFDLVDSLDGAKFKIRIPVNWNGTLLIYLQGSKTGTAPAEPLLVPPVLPGSQPPLEQSLLSSGYALAASQVATSEWQQKAKAQDSFALTTYFRGRVGEPSRIILLGASLGALAALRLIEESPRSFDACV